MDSTDLVVSLKDNVTAASSVSGQWESKRVAAAVASPLSPRQASTAVILETKPCQGFWPHSSPLK